MQHTVSHAVSILVYRASALAQNPNMQRTSRVSNNTKYISKTVSHAVSILLYRESTLAQNPNMQRTSWVSI